MMSSSPTHGCFELVHLYDTIEKERNRGIKHIVRVWVEGVRIDYYGTNSEQGGSVYMPPWSIDMDLLRLHRIDVSELGLGGTPIWIMGTNKMDGKRLKIPFGFHGSQIISLGNHGIEVGMWIRAIEDPASHYLYWFSGQRQSDCSSIKDHYRHSVDTKDLGKFFLKLFSEEDALISP